ncbi:MAG: hypothetical protein O6829_06705 [Alphaproteobacteria bacterium]|nr:hypothetical protein [Alphaproteobacteria bacterium]
MRQLVVIIMLVAAGCSTRSYVRTVSATPASITMVGRSFVWDEVPADQKMADIAVEHCRKYGRQARLFIDTGEPGGGRRFTFHCVP